MMEETNNLIDENDALSRQVMVLEAKITAMIKEREKFKALENRCLQHARHASQLLILEKEAHEESMNRTNEMKAEKIKLRYQLSQSVQEMEMYKTLFELTRNIQEAKARIEKAKSEMTPKSETREKRIEEFKQKISKLEGELAQLQIQFQRDEKQSNDSKMFSSNVRNKEVLEMATTFRRQFEEFVGFLEEEGNRNEKANNEETCGEIARECKNEMKEEDYWKLRRLNKIVVKVDEWLTRQTKTSQSEVDNLSKQS